MRRRIRDARQGNLFEIVGALRFSSRFSCRLNSRDKQTNENGDNRNDDQQFYQSESILIIHDFNKDVTYSAPIGGTVPTAALKQEFNYSHVIIYSILKRITRGNK